jgi:hypothetical protein
MRQGNGTRSTLRRDRMDCSNSPVSCVLSRALGVRSRARAWTTHNNWCIFERRSRRTNKQTRQIRLTQRVKGMRSRFTACEPSSWPSALSKRSEMLGPWLWLFDIRPDIASSKPELPRRTESNHAEDGDVTRGGMRVGVVAVAVAVVHRA